MCDNFDQVIGLGGFVVGLVGIGYAIGTHSRMKEVCDKLEYSLDHITRDTDIDIPDKMIEVAVQRAVNREAEYAIGRITTHIATEADKSIRNVVTTEVSNQKSRISADVTKEITKRVANINESELKREVIEKAKEQVAAKFDDKLDDVLEDFSGNLKNVSKIYESIAKTMTKNDDSGKQMVFRIA